MQVTIQFNTDNAAFEDDFAAEVLAAAKAGAEGAISLAPYWGLVGMTLRDSNGNTIGNVRVDRNS